MAQSDRKRARYRSSGGSYTRADADADDRTESKDALDYIMAHADVQACLDAMGDVELLRLVRRMSKITRYGDYDWNRVLAKLSDSGRKMIQERLVQAKAVEQEQNERENAERKKRWEAADAVRVEQQSQEADTYRQTAGLAAGMLRSDMHDVYELRDKTGQYYGDWIDDPVALLTGGDGWGRSVKEQTGIKLQITLSLDASNSMWHNKIGTDATKAFIELGMALDELVDAFPGSVFANQFLFAMREEGKWTMPLNGYAGDWDNKVANAAESMGKYDAVRHWATSIPWDAGEDTWIAPLFSRIEEWENESSDPGCVRLDLVLTDAVLEHPMDVRDASMIQERRDGALQTILLNFLPEEDWLGSALPKHCVEYPANPDNVAGLLRKLLMEFVSVYY